VIGPVVRRLARRIRRLRSRLAPHNVLVLGDSHARVFKHWWFDALFPLTRYDVCIVGGATASGLHNPNSKTQAYAHFRDALARVQTDSVVFLLGEVDTGYVIWFRAERRAGTVEEMLALAIDTYCDFLRSVAESGKKVTVVSAPLPTIEDGAPKGEVAENRREVQASQRARTELTLEFNRRMSLRCGDLGYEFVDLDSQSLGPNGLVVRRLLNPDPADHHFAPEPYARMLAWRLRRLSAPRRS
jgi:hypothetical protein